MPSSLSLSLSVSAVQIIHKRRRRGCPSIRRCWKMSLRWSFIDPWKWIRNASTNRYGSSRPRITIIVVGYWIISLSLSRSLLLKNLPLHRSVERAYGGTNGMLYAVHRDHLLVAVRMEMRRKDIMAHELYFFLASISSRFQPITSMSSFPQWNPRSSHPFSSRRSQLHEIFITISPPDK